MKVIGRAFAEYVQRHGTFPQAAPGQPAVSWRVSFLPFVDAQELFEQYDQSSDWDDRVNLPVARRVLPGYRCPANINDRDVKDRYYCDYVMATGPGTVAPGDRSVRPAEVTDGTANTLLAVEASGLNVVWTEPRDFDVSREPIGVNLGGTGRTDSPGMLSSYHAYGAHALFADGSARFIPETIDPRVLRAMATIAGGDYVPSGR